MFPGTFASLLMGLSDPAQQFGFGGDYAPQFGQNYQSDPYATAPYTQPVPEQRSMFDQLMGRLPQPFDVFGGGPPVAPVYRPGWSEFFQQLPGLFAPPRWGPTPPDFETNPEYWPPGMIPYGPRF